MSDRYLCKAKRTDNGEWVEGYYCKRKTGDYTNIGFVEKYKDCIMVEFSDGGITLCDVDPFTICQYTGLKDKNCKKIWENDIVKSTNSGDIGIIKFGLYNSKHYGFYIKWVGNLDYREDIFYWCNNHFLKIAGNTLDNPEFFEEVHNED